MLAVDPKVGGPPVGPMAARRLLRFRSARSPPKRARDRSHGSSRRTGPRLLRRTPKDPTSTDGTSRGFHPASPRSENENPTVSVRFTRRCSVSDSPPKLRRASAVPRSAPKDWRRWFERRVHRRDPKVVGEGRRLDTDVAPPEGAVSSVRHSSAHPEGWRPNPSLVPEGARGRVACTRRCEARGSGLISSELEGPASGQTDDVFIRKARTRSEDQSLPVSPKATEPTLARRGRG